MASSRMKSGIRRLSDVARKVVAPAGIAFTGWPQVEHTCRYRLGVEFDDWQVGAGRLILGKRADGKLACMVGGVGMSLPRQVGKTYLIGAMIFALCVDTPGLLVIWSAHHARTHAETFLAMQAFAKRSKVDPYVDKIYTGSGDEEIRFHNGSRILFGARERGFGRGIPGVDIIVSDEAQIMSDRALDAQLATMNTSGFGLAIYVGTPPRPDDPSEAFTRMRLEAWSGDLQDAVWIEFGADPGAKPNDRAQWAKANPSYPRRTPAESMLRLQRKLKPDSFLREGLGVWDDGSGPSVFGAGAWDACAAGGRPASLRVGGLALAASWDLAHAAVAAAGVRDGVAWVRPLEHGPGSGWVVHKLVGLQRRHDVDVAVDERGPAADLIPDLVAAGVRLRLVNTADALDAWAGIYKRVRDGTLRHQHYAELDRAVDGAVERNVGDRRALGRRTSRTDVSALESVMLAAWLAEQRPEITPPPPPPVRESSTVARAKGGGDLLTVGF